MGFSQDIQKERIELDIVAKRSVLAKAINESILRPILDDVETASREILDDLGFMIVSELQHRLATAPTGFTYRVYQHDPGAPKGKKYNFIGYYTASPKGGAPASGIQTNSGLPTGSLYESLYYSVDPNGILNITVQSPEGSEKGYWHVGSKVILMDKSPVLPVGEYFNILNDPDGSRPEWFDKALARKRNYWNRWLSKRFMKAVKKSSRRWTVHRALKFNIYWESTR